MQQDELVVVVLAQLAARGVGQVVVVRHDDVLGVDHVHILNRDKGEGELAVLAADLGHALGVLDVEQVDVADLAHEAVGICVLQADLVNAFEFGRYVLAVRARRAVAGRALKALAVVTLDDQAGVGIDHVEVADVVAVEFQRVLPGAASPLALGHIEFEDAQVLAALLALPFLLGLIPQWAFKQWVEILAIF